MNEAQFEAHRLLSIAKAGKIPKKSKQSGSGCDDKGQMGEGHCGDQMGEGPRLRWLGPTLAQHTPFENGQPTQRGRRGGRHGALDRHGVWRRACRRTRAVRRRCRRWARSCCVLGGCVAGDVSRRSCPAAPRASRGAASRRLPAACGARHFAQPTPSPLNPAGAIRSNHSRVIGPLHQNVAGVYQSATGGRHW